MAFEAREADRGVGAPLRIEEGQKMSHATKTTIAALGLIGLIGTPAAASQGDASFTRPQLLGRVSPDEGCSAAERDFLEVTMSYGRTAAATVAFEQCLEQQVRTTYRKCIGDPWYDSTLNRQIGRAIAIAQSPNEVSMACSGGAGNASASIGTYGHEDAESFAWGGWFRAVRPYVDRPICQTGQSPDADGCRLARSAWPYSQAAGIVWHEAFHTHGYTHGTGEQESAKTACGYDADPTWHFQVNTMPYIVGSCLNQVIDDSAATCGLHSCPGANQLSMTDGYQSTTCTCTNDPADKGLGILGFDRSRGPRALVDKAILPEGEWVGSWHYGTENVPWVPGDFDGDGRDDLLLLSDWGLGLLSHDDAGWHELASAAKGTTFAGLIGRWTYDSSTRIAGVGNFSGDSRDEILVKSDSAIGILRFDPARRALRTILRKPSGTWFGGWNFDAAANAIGPVGDFNGDGYLDFVITSDWGMGILTHSGTGLRLLAAVASGTPLGGFLYERGTTAIAGVGDFDGNGTDDLLVVNRTGSSPGIAALSWTTMSTLTAILSHPSGTWFGSWNFDSRSNSIRAVGDFDGDGRDDFAITSPWGLGILTRSGAGSFSTLVALPNGTRLRGGWVYDSSTTQVLGRSEDLTGDGRDDLLFTGGTQGLGVIKLGRSPTRSWLQATDVVPFETLAGSWLLEDDDWISTLGDFDGDGAFDLVVEDD